MNPTAKIAIVLACAGLVLPCATAAGASHEDSARPLVIGHRGTAGHRPEHTLASYELAARMGADYIEPDLVSTQDHVLVARHENEISATTDVAAHPEFAARQATKVIDGVTLTGWFTEDFTLAELRTLRAKERIPQLRQRNTIYDGRYRVPTFEGVIWLVQLLGAKTQRPADDSRTYAQFATQAVLADVARYADGIGPSKDYIVPRDAAGASLAPTSFIGDAHAAGLLVHPYTFRNENSFLPLELRRGSDPGAWGNAIAEYEQFFALGVDGVFSDHADTAVDARDGAID